MPGCMSSNYLFFLNVNNVRQVFVSALPWRSLVAVAVNSRVKTSIILFQACHRKLYMRKTLFLV